MPKTDEKCKFLCIHVDQDLFQNIVLTGGSTLIKGLKERIEFEVKKLAPGAPVEIYQDSNRRFATWIGLNSYRLNRWINAIQYVNFRRVQSDPAKLQRTKPQYHFKERVLMNNLLYFSSNT